MGFCTKYYWCSKSLLYFKQMIKKIEEVTAQTFEYCDISLLFENFSLFVIFLHFFNCLRSCDTVSKYCSVCSRVRDHNFDKKIWFNDIVFKKLPIKEHLGLEGKLIDFDVFLRRWSSYNNTISSSAPNDCDYRERINYAYDLFMNYVSVMIRVVMNSSYDYFLSIPLLLDKEEEIVKIVHKFAQDIPHEF